MPLLGLPYHCAVIDLLPVFFWLRVVWELSVSCVGVCVCKLASHRSKW